MNIPDRWKDLAHKWVDGAQIQCKVDEGDWRNTRYPGWCVNDEYREMPKQKVKMWKWVMRDAGGTLFITTYHYKNSEECLRVGFSSDRQPKLIQKIDDTMIEVEE